MKTNRTALSMRSSLAWPAVSRAAGLLIAGLIGWLWFVVVKDPTWKALAWKVVPIVVVLPLAARLGIKWLEARARRRLWAAWDAYAEHELAKRTNSRSNFPVRPQSQQRSNPL